MEPYTQKNTKKLTLRAYLSREIDCKKINLCKYCGKKIDTNLFDDNNLCHSCIGKEVNNFGFRDLDKRKVANCIFLLQKKGINYSKIKSIFQKECNYSLNSIIKYNGKNCKKFFKCPETGYFLPITKKSEVLYVHLNKFNIDIIEYLKTYFPEYIGHCKYCNSIC